MAESAWDAEAEVSDRLDAADWSNRDDAADGSNRDDTVDETDGADRTSAAGAGRARYVSDAIGTAPDGPAMGPPALTAIEAAVTTKIVTASEFRTRLSELLELSHRQPVTVMSRGARARGVLVSADFFDRACSALGDEPYARPPRTRLEEIMAENRQFLEFL